MFSSAQLSLCPLPPLSVLFILSYSPLFSHSSSLSISFPRFSCPLLSSLSIMLSSFLSLSSLNSVITLPHFPFPLVHLSFLPSLFLPTLLSSVSSLFSSVVLSLSVSVSSFRPSLLSFMLCSVLLYSLVFAPFPHSFVALLSLPSS